MQPHCVQCIVGVVGALNAQVWQVNPMGVLPTEGRFYAGVVEAERDQKGRF